MARILQGMVENDDSLEFELLIEEPLFRPSRTSFFPISGQDLVLSP